MFNAKLLVVAGGFPDPATKMTGAMARRMASAGGPAAHEAYRSPVSFQLSTIHISAVLQGVEMARSLLNERECHCANPRAGHTVLTRRNERLPRPLWFKD
jgi:hypothetical protein